MACRSSWQSPAPAARITGRAQELFIEYAHYLPERACDAIVGRMRELVDAEIGSTDLSTPMDASAVLHHTSSILSGEEVPPQRNHLPLHLLLNNVN